MVFGVERASLVMPRAYWLENQNELSAFLALCRSIVAAGEGRQRVFIMKNAYQHQQKGISLSSAQQLIDRGVTDGFHMATEFLSHPFIVKKYKINMRRYMVAICHKGKLRGYVHDDGKNIYPKRPYREPWEGEEWEKNNRAFNQRLEELITTGYVPESHYKDKPLSGLEFFEYVREELGLDPSTLQQSMWQRLALALHISVRDRKFDLCELDPKKIQTARTPNCLKDAVRFQHFGCDFNIDQALNGYESRLFECNKGPDMSVHSYRDGKMKRDVAADIISFIGFQGEFDGSQENARKHHLTLIYDSETFDPAIAFDFLGNLEMVDVRINRGGNVEKQPPLDANMEEL